MSLKMNSFICTRLQLQLQLAIIFLTCIVNIITSSTIPKQSYTIYETANYGGASESYYGNVPDLDVVSNLVKRRRMRSRCVQGLWKEFGDKNYNYLVPPADQHISSLITSVHIRGSSSQCAVLKEFNGTYEQVKSIRTVGHSNTASPALSLFVGPNLEKEELYLEGSLLQLPLSRTFQSYGITGPSKWTLYSGTSFKGSFECLLPNNVTLIAFSLSKPIQVGSIRRGCEQTYVQSDITSGNIGRADTTLLNWNLSSTVTLYGSYVGEELTTDGKVRLPMTRPFISYRVSGNKQAWSLSPDSLRSEWQRSKNATCLRTDTKTDDLIHFTNPLRVGSIQPSCPSCSNQIGHIFEFFVIISLISNVKTCFTFILNI